jgi:hypothetical protein
VYERENCPMILPYCYYLLECYYHSPFQKKSTNNVRSCLLRRIVSWFLCVPSYLNLFIKNVTGINSPWKKILTLSKIPETGSELQKWGDSNWFQNSKCNINWANSRNIFASFPNGRTTLLTTKEDRNLRAYSSQY